MFTVEDHIDNLVRHIGMVQENCLLVGQRLIKAGRIEFGVRLIQRGFCHDNSKFEGLEWQTLHQDNSIPKELLKLAIENHQQSNDHHPEYHLGIQNMSEICIYEMVMDWAARSQEFGSSLKGWIQDKAITKYNIDINGTQYKQINECLDILFEGSFSE